MHVGFVGVPALFQQQRQHFGHGILGGIVNGRVLVVLLGVRRIGVEALSQFSFRLIQSKGRFVVVVVQRTAKLGGFVAHLIKFSTVTRLPYQTKNNLIKFSTVTVTRLPLPNQK